MRYIWDYYWLPIVGFTAGLLFLIYFLSHLLFGNKEYWFYVTFVNIKPPDRCRERAHGRVRGSERGYDLSKIRMCFLTMPAISTPRPIPGQTIIIFKCSSRRSRPVTSTL